MFLTIRKIPKTRIAQRDFLFKSLQHGMSSFSLESCTRLFPFIRYKAAYSSHLLISNEVTCLFVCLLTSNFFFYELHVPVYCCFPVEGVIISSSVYDNSYYMKHIKPLSITYMASVFSLLVFFVCLWLVVVLQCFDVVSISLL